MSCHFSGIRTAYSREARMFFPSLTFLPWGLKVVMTKLPDSRDGYLANHNLKRIWVYLRTFQLTQSICRSPCRGPCRNVADTANPGCAYPIACTRPIVVTFLGQTTATAGLSERLESMPIHVSAHHRGPCFAQSPNKYHVDPQKNAREFTPPVPCRLPSVYLPTAARIMSVDRAPAIPAIPENSAPRFCRTSAIEGALDDRRVHALSKYL
jgi:hypothetical protein